VCYSDLYGALFKSVLEVLRIDPETGKVTPFELPYDSEDLAFDTNGLAYLRALHAVGRFDPASWREVPWDYGEERDAVNHNNETGRKRRAPLASGLIVPVSRYNHQGGLYISPRAHIVVCSYFGRYEPKLRNEYPTAHIEGRPYPFRLYPGRQTFGLVNIWDEQGRIVHSDALKGMAFTNGIAIDKEGKLWVAETTDSMNQPLLNSSAPAWRRKISAPKVR
jgi:hypothetical protein